MSPSDSLGILVASPGVPGIEVSVFDGRLRRLRRDEATDQFRWAVPRGIYTVRYQAGSAIDEHLVTVDQLQRPVIAPAAQLEFTSSAPLTQTSSTHEYHTAPAVEASRAAPLKLGHGALLFAMVRSRHGAFAHETPARGLTLQRHRKVIYDFTELQRDPGNTCAAAHIELDPGPYTLVYETAASVTNQTIYLAKKWQTQLFISEAAERGSAALDVLGLAVLMARPGIGFKPDGPGLHAAELARKALRRGQSAISAEQIQQLLDDKFGNPILGILGAHLLLLHSDTRKDLVETVLANLDRIAPGHPDTACLRLALNPMAAVQISAPPMIARSWDLLVHASTHGARLQDSTGLEEVAGSLWDTGGAWLTWGWMKTPIRVSEHPAFYGLMGHPTGYSNPTRHSKIERVLAREILKLVADDGAKESESLRSTRKNVLRLSTPLGSALAEELRLSEFEAGFINLTTLAYGHTGREGLKAELLAPQVRMPVPLVRGTARDLAKRLEPPTTPVIPSTPRSNPIPGRRSDPGISRSVGE